MATSSVVAISNLKCPEPVLRAVSALIAYTEPIGIKSLVRFPHVEKSLNSDKVRIVLRNPMSSVMCADRSSTFHAIGLRSDAEANVAAQTILNCLKEMGHASIALKSVKVNNYNYLAECDFKVDLNRMAAVANGTYEPAVSPGCVIKLANCSVQVFFSGKVQLHASKPEYVAQCMPEIFKSMLKCQVEA